MQGSNNDLQTSSSQASHQFQQRPVDEDTTSSLSNHQEQQQQHQEQQDLAEDEDNHSLDSYSTDFSSSDTEEEQQTQEPQEHESQTEEPAGPTSPTNQPTETGSRSSSETGNRQQRRGRSSSGRTRTSSSSEKLPRTRSATTRGSGAVEMSSTRSRAIQKEERSSGQPHFPRGSPPRQENGSSPDRANTTLHDYHLKYSNNDDVRQWLKCKNKLLRRQRKEKRALERNRRRQLEADEQEREERRQRSDILVQRWMDEKRTEMRMLNKRQQQNPKTLDHPQQDSTLNKVRNDQKRPDPAHQNGQRALSATKNYQKSEKISSPVKDERSNVPLFSRPGKGKFDTLPGAETRKSPGKSVSEAERRAAYGNWLGRNRTEDKSKPELLRGDDNTSFQRVPRPPDQGSGRVGRCTSARGRRRRKGEGLSPTTEGRRPRSGVVDTMGTRLEPQGADGLDAVPELDDTLGSTSKQGDSSPDLEVVDLLPPKKDSSGNVDVPSTSSEFRGRKTSFGDSCVIGDQDRDSEEKVREEQEREFEEDHSRLGPKMRSSRDLLEVIKSESRVESRSSSSVEDHEEEPTQELEEDEEHLCEDGEQETVEEGKVSEVESAAKNEHNNTDHESHDGRVVTDH